MSVAMQPLSLPTPSRLSALLAVFAWVGADAQTPVAGSSSSKLLVYYRDDCIGEHLMLTRAGQFATDLLRSHMFHRLSR